MKIKHLLASATLVLAIGACGKKGSGGGGGDWEAFIKLDTEKGVAFTAGGTDCAAKAKSVGDWRKANTANYNVMRKNLNAAFPKGPPEEIQKKYGDQMKKNKSAVMDAMLACSNDEAFGKMMDETKTE